MNLVIGNTSQLSYYFPENYIKISSRDIDFEYLKNNKWESIYITFSEQGINNTDADYININYNYTLSIINTLIDNSNKIVIYTTCELWNKYTGVIDIDMEPNYIYDTQYVLSKYLLIYKIYELRKKNDKYYKVIIIHPFYFNSIYRNKYFLFGKIFDSIINKKKIEIGDTYFYRDMVHTKYIVKRSIESKKDEIVGAGRLYFVNDFIRDLYKYSDMNYDEYVKEILPEKKQEKIYYSKQNIIYTYENLLNDTLNDLNFLNI